MAMMSKRDKPTYYNIIDPVTKVIVATAPRSKVQALHKKLQHELGRTFAMEMIQPPVACTWFALCENVAVTTEPHPVLGAVPICQRCLDKVQRLRAPR
jgi:hypothetical protein